VREVTGWTLVGLIQLIVFNQRIARLFIEGRKTLCLARVRVLRGKSPISPGQPIIPCCANFETNTRAREGGAYHPANYRPLHRPVTSGYERDERRMVPARGC
jgi:hypothetical protein